MWLKIPRGTRVSKTQVPVDTYRARRRRDPRRRRKKEERRRKKEEEEIVNASKIDKEEEIVNCTVVCKSWTAPMEILNYNVDRQSGCAWWRLGLCVPWVFFFAVDLLLLSFFLLGYILSSFFLSARLPSFFFLSLGFSFSGFVVFYSVYFEIKCKRLKISGISHWKLSLKDSVLLCRTRLFKTLDLCGIIVHNSVQLSKYEASL